MICHWKLAVLLGTSLIRTAHADALDELNSAGTDAQIRRAVLACASAINQRTGGGGLFGPCINQHGKWEATEITANAFRFHFSVSKDRSSDSGLERMVRGTEVLVTCETDLSGGITKLESRKKGVLDLLTFPSTCAPVATDMRR